VLKSNTIVGYEWESNISVVFRTDNGERIMVADGSAWQFDEGSTTAHPVCTTNLECARLKVSGLDIDNIQSRMPPQSQRRALQQSVHTPGGGPDEDVSGSCNDPEQIKAGFTHFFQTNEEFLNNLTRSANVIDEAGTNLTEGEADFMFWNQTISNATRTCQVAK
jgi:hypothetical protein